MSRLARDSRAGRRLAACVLALAMAGCSSLSPREPNPPEGEVELINLESIEKVFEQINVGFENEDIAQYVNAFNADTFEFHPDLPDSQSVSANNPTAFEGTWDRERERQVTSFLFDDFDYMFAVFRPCTTGDCPGNTTPDVDQRFWFYELRTVAAGAQDTTRFFGRANLTVLRQSAQWRIVIWLDGADPTHAGDERTWGFLRGDNAP